MRRSFWMFLLTLCIGPVLAQGGSCPAIVNEVLNNLDAICSGTGRNQACYGNVSLEASAHPDAAQFKFDAIGDIESVENIQSLRLSPLIEEENLWGVTLMQLQANLPDTLPGQNVTFLLFGDVEVINAVDPNNPDASPMQAFYLKTGVADPACNEVPQDGVLVQTPKGRGEVMFSVNGVDMAIGSTAFLTSSSEFQVTMLEGSGAVRCEGSVSPVLAGTGVMCPLGDDFTPSGPPSTPMSVEPPPSLPLSLLEEEIVPAEPLSDVQLQILGLLSQGEEAPCGLSFLPGCDNLISSLGGENCPLNDVGEPDCTIELEPVWDNVVDPNAGPPNFSSEPTPEETELPPGCEAGICLKDPAEACKCVLCGVACPVATTPAPVSTPDCESNPDALTCQTSDAGGRTGDDRGGENTGDTTAPVPTNPPEPTVAPDPANECTEPFPFLCGNEETPPFGG